MSTLATSRLLEGRRIVGFEANRFPDGRGGTAHRPVIVLDNGARLTFVTEETEIGDYGVACVYHPPRHDGRCHHGLEECPACEDGTKPTCCRNHGDGSVCGEDYGGHCCEGCPNKHAK